MMGTPPQGLMPFWMFCDGSTTAEKLAFMKRCHAGGIRALTMHPRAGNRVPFGSREWWMMIRDLVEEAARLGMKLWLYDEDPYPSGAAGGWVMARRPDLQARAFHILEAPISLRPGSLWTISRDVVVWAGLIPKSRGHKPIISLTHEVGPIRQDWFAVEWDSRYYYADTPLYSCPRGAAVRMRYCLRVPRIPSGYRLAAVTLQGLGEDGPWGSLPDLLNPETFEIFRICGLEPYAEWVGAHFGKTIPGIFTDEAKPFGGVPFTADLFDSFRARYGYELAERLPALFHEPRNSEDEEVRQNYREWIRDRFLSAFVEPYRKWCERHGLWLVGHFSPEDDPIEEAACLPAAMPIMKAMGWPGCDVIIPAVGDARHPSLNLGSLRISSLKDQFGHPACSSETQALGDWTITTAETRRIYAWQKVLGVDRFFTHGFWNSLDGITNYEAPPDYGPNTPLFPGTAAVNEWLNRCDALLDGARPKVETAVLNNMLPYWTWGSGMKTGVFGRFRRSLWMTILHCLQAHVGLHIADAEDIAQGAAGIEGLTVGRWTYRTILVPAGDRMEGRVFQKLEAASRTGIRVVWLGNGPRWLRDCSGKMKPAPVPAGERLTMLYPSAGWCAESLSPVVKVSGPGRGECYVRRFRAKDACEYLMAVNISKTRRLLTFQDEFQTAWVPVTGLADGEFGREKGCLKWSAPAGGVAFLTLGRSEFSKKSQRPFARICPTANHVEFRRLEPNVLRLDACRVTLGAHAGRILRYPQPYWQVFKKYKATEIFNTWGGALPVESTVEASDLRYHFRVESATRIPKAVLVLDPRCARGRFRLYWDGRAFSDWLDFPLECIQPHRLPIPVIQPGAHLLAVHFDVQSAMEGLLAILRVEGEFDVRLLKRGRPVLTDPGLHKNSDCGWTEMGLPHYMGAGLYRWVHSFGADDLRAGQWCLELDEVRDNASLVVNGHEIGVRAWPPWRWLLPREVLKEGGNRFELTVRSTAGNRIALVYPRQAQGWLGKARLVHGFDTEAGSVV